MKRWYETQYPPKDCKDCNQMHSHIPQLEGFFPVEVGFEVIGQWHEGIPNSPCSILFWVEALMPPYSSQIKSLIGWN